MQPFEHPNNQTLALIWTIWLFFFQPISAINQNNFDKDPMQSQLQVEYILTKKTSLFKRSTYII